jgi:threonyl-tRNA synthetase
MSGLRETLDSHDLESISDEDGSSLIVFLPGGELTTTELIVIDSREIIVYQCMCVYHLESDQIWEDDISWESHELLISEHGEYGA